MEEATAEAEVTERDLEGAWAEAAAGAGATGWATAGAVAAAEDKDAAWDTDTARECVRGVPRPGTFSITAGEDSPAFAAVSGRAASATRIATI